jgi:hypothetical protein
VTDADGGTASNIVRIDVQYRNIKIMTEKERVIFHPIPVQKTIIEKAQPKLNQ